MGFAVDDQLDAGAELWEAAQAELDHQASRDDPELYARYQRLISADKAVAASGRRQAELWQSVVTRIPDGGEALFVTHGGLIEPGLIVALLNGGITRTGPVASSIGEGARLRHNGGRFIEATLGRPSMGGHRAENPGRHDANLGETGLGGSSRLRDTLSERDELT